MIKKSSISEIIAGNPISEHVWVSEHKLIYEAPHVYLSFSMIWNIKNQGMYWNILE